VTSPRVSPALRENTARSRARDLFRPALEWMRRQPLRAPVVFIAIAATAAVLAWSRFLPANRDILWAEDGRNFLQDAINTGPFGSLLRPYAGYLHTIPRIIAGVTVALAPVRDYAVWMTAGSCIAAGVMAAIVFVCSSSIVRWVPGRLMLAGITVLVPLAPREVLGNTANLHSLVLWTLCWVLVYRPRTRLGVAGLALFTLLGAMTEIQSVFLLPLLLLFRTRDRGRWLVRGCYLVGVAAQLFVTVFWPRHHSGNPLIGLPSLLYGYLFNSSASVWVPQHQAGVFAVQFGIAGCALLALPFVAAFCAILRWGTRRMRLFATALVLLSVTVYVASIEDSPRPSYDYAALDPSQLAAAVPIRYGVVPSLLLCALIPIACALIVARTRARLIDRPRIARGCVAAATIILCLAMVAQFVPPTRRSTGPQWQPEVRAATLLCDGQSDATRVRLGETIGWYVEVPCGLLENQGGTGLLTAP
jgi:hypothetical protein